MSKKFSSGKGAMPQRLLTSPENLKKLNSIVCLNLPPQLLDRVNFKRHFSKFGKVVKVSLSGAKNSGIVHFDSHQSANNAKQHGCEGMPPNFQIFWSQTRKSLDSADAPPKRPINSEVEDELQSMAGGDYVAMRRDRNVPMRQPNFGGSSQMKKPGNVFSKINTPPTFKPTQPRVDFFAPKPAGPPFGQQTAVNPPPLFQPFDKTRLNVVASKRDAPKAPPQALFPRTEPGLKTAVLPSPGLFQAAIQPPSMETPALPLSLPVAPPTSAQPSNPHNAQRATLWAAVKKKAQSNGDILAILEARDKLLRLGSAKSTVASAVKTLGSCNDMCPEKERYLRMERHQVAQYELVNGQADHRYFVKEYSRSSADQELPLAHELRSSAVLRRTMNYLLFNIAPRVDHPGEHLGDWFLFMWDRTRAIRKEVTQQELCNEDAVVMLEQCARFHIACAARLAEESVHDFDSKINSENLAKCLQTLKHLYHDMVVSGKACPNEAEFRAYIVLLNLNTGDAIWEVQQLSGEVLASAPVQMAIRAYLALSTHNYVQFFKLVGYIGYFGGAILMRYFTQVRTKALEVLIRSHCQSIKSSFSFPLADMTRMLCFEDVASATEFCQYHGLDTTADLVVLSKTTYMTPESAVPTRRAKFLVESQLRATFAEAIAGYHAQQDFFDPPEAMSSFDARAGMLTPEVFKELEEKGKVEASNIALSKNIFSEQSLFAPANQGGPIFARPANTGGALFQRAIVPNQMQKQHQQLVQQSEAIFKNILQEAIPPMVNEVTSIVLKDMKQTRLAQNIAKAQYPKLLSEILKDIVATELLAAKEAERAKKMALLKEQQREAARQEAIRIKSAEVTKRILNEVTLEEAGKLARSELLREKKLIHLSNAAWELLLEDFYETIVSRQVEDELREAQRVWRKRVQELFDRLLSCRVKRMLLKWRDSAKRIRQRRERLQKFPPCASLLDQQQQIAELSIVSPQRKPVYSTNKIIKEVKDIRSIGTQSTMPLVAIDQVSTLLKMSTKLPIFLLGDKPKSIAVWRVIFSVPDDDEDLKTLAYLCFAGGRLSSDGRASTFLCNDVIMRFELSFGCDPCLDADAIVMVVKDEKDAACRLEELVKDRPAVCVALLVVGQESIGKELKSFLRSLCAIHSIVRFCSFSLGEKHNLPDKAQDALKWLAMSSKNSLESYVVAPSSDLMLSLVDVSFWHSALMAAGPNNSIQQLHEKPDLCLKIVNAAVKHLRALVEEPVAHLCREEEDLIIDACPNLPPYWNQTQFRHKVSKTLETQILPAIDFDAKSLQNCSWSDVIKKFSTFCKNLPMEPSQTDVVFRWVSHQLLSYKQYSPSELPWANILASLLKEFVLRNRLCNPMSPSGPELFLALSSKQLETFTACNWCSKELLAEFEPAQHEEGTATKRTAQKSPKRDLFDKLQSLLQGLEEIKSKRIKMDKEYF